MSVGVYGLNNHHGTVKISSIKHDIVARRALSTFARQRYKFFAVFFGPPILISDQFGPKFSGIVSESSPIYSDDSSNSFPVISK